MKENIKPVLFGSTGMIGKGVLLECLDNPRVVSVLLVNRSKSQINHPKIKEVFQLGNYLVWVAPSGTALVIDANDGKKDLSDAEIDKLFDVKK